MRSAYSGRSASTFGLQSLRGPIKTIERFWGDLESIFARGLNFVSPMPVTAKMSPQNTAPRMLCR